MRACLSVLCIVFAIACSSKPAPPADLCAHSTACPNDPNDGNALSGIPTAACNGARAGVCGSVYDAWLKCAWSNQTCKSDGTTDIDALDSDCQSEHTSAVICCSNNPGEC